MIIGNILDDQELFEDFIYRLESNMEKNKTGCQISYDYKLENGVPIGDPIMEKGAYISEDLQHRYRLWRIWDKDKPSVMFIMLNPSTADHKDDDPTIRRCINYAKAWGYGSLYVGNLYSFRTSSPKELRSSDNYHMTIKNFQHLKEMAQECEEVICAWGNDQGRPIYIFGRFPARKLRYLKLSQKGIPMHPLYLKKELTPQEFY